MPAVLAIKRLLASFEKVDSVENRCILKGWGVSKEVREQEGVFAALRIWDLIKRGEIKDNFYLSNSLLWKWRITRYIFFPSTYLIAAKWVTIYINAWMKHLDHLALPWNRLTLQLPNFLAISRKNNTVRLQWTCSPSVWVTVMMELNRDGQRCFHFFHRWCTTVLKMTGRCAPFPQNTLNSFSRASTLKASGRLICICAYVKWQWGDAGLKWQES